MDVGEPCWGICLGHINELNPEKFKLIVEDHFIDACDYHEVEYNNDYYLHWKLNSLEFSFGIVYMATVVPNSTLPLDIDSIGSHYILVRSKKL